MKALKAQLIAAIAMTLVAALTIGSSTYAWFAMNSVVTATGMFVKAQSGKNLVISTTSTKSGDEGASRASTYTEIVNMEPASVATLAGSQNFFRSSETDKVDYESGTVNVGAKFVAVTPATSGATAAVAKHTFYIRAVDADTAKTFSNLYVSGISMLDSSKTSASHDISAALRVGVVCGDKGYIYAPHTNATATYQAINAEGTVAVIDDTSKIIYADSEKTKPLSTSTTALKAFNSTNVLSTSISTDYTQVDIYIWYEGQDPKCTSANAVNVEQLEISVVFSASAT